MSAGWVALWVAWALLVVGSFALIEYLSLRNSKDRRPPLTQVIQRWVPRWLIAVVLGGFAFWGLDHFNG